MASFRFGWTRFPDNQTLTLPFDPATLGFNSKFIGLIPSDPNAHKFPGGDIEGYDQAAGQTFGAITPEFAQLLLEQRSTAPSRASSARTR